MSSGYIIDNDKERLVEKYAKEFGFTRITYSPGSTTYIRMNESEEKDLYPFSILKYNHGMDYVNFSSGDKTEKFKIGDLSLGILENTCIHEARKQ